jgi:hypothetical protein
MELLFVVLIAAVFGLAVRYVLGGRDTYGAALLPAVSAAVASIVWVGLLWLGLTFDGTWIWVISLIAGPLVALFAGLALPRNRRAADRAQLTKLSGGKA